MEDLIEQYLFQRKQCPLPEIGSLRIIEEKATLWHGDNKISAPVPKIELTDTEIPSAPFIEFIAAHGKITKGEASLLLESYCQELKKLSAYKEMKLSLAGRFYVDTSGNLTFRQEPVPKEFLPSIPVQFVSHPKPMFHQIKVGDKESNNELMTEYFSEKEKPVKVRWWIPAIILTIIAACFLVLYLTQHSNWGNFGNVQKVEPRQAPQTYRTQ